jgi:hypothetical protein
LCIKKDNKKIQTKCKKNKKCKVKYMANMCVIILK